MARHERIKRERLEDSEVDSHQKKKRQQQEYDQLKAADEGVTAWLAEPSLERHAALLIEARSDKQRADLVTQLQQSYGNAYVQRLLSSHIVQAKLTVNPPDDVYEREADRVAETIQRQPMEEEEELQMKASRIQRQGPEEEELQMKASQIQRQAEEEEEEEEPIQTRTVGSQPSVTSDDLEGQINAARGSGQPLPDSVRASLEPHFGHDFSEVRIHTDAEADRLSRQLDAEAFTTGKDVFFREGAYQPESETGKGLIAHELTHVVQQQEAPVAQRNALEPTATTDAEAPAAGLDETRMAVLRALWEATVVRPIREAYEALAGATPDARRAVDSLGSTEAPLSAMKEAYRGTEPAFSVLSGFYQYIARKIEELRPHVGQPRPLEQIRESINPSGETMPVWFNRVTQAI